MPTTSNFGWTTPADTDLVKDGALAIRTLGNGIDTSFLDLKGGTTGQILSKASNADLDYTWINNDQGDITGVTAGTGITGGGTSGTVTITNSMATEITAAGDIIVGTGSGTFDNLPIGTTGQVLTADTTVSPYKVKWATAGAASFVGCTIYRSSAQAVANNTDTTIDFDSEYYDTDAFHSTSSNTSRMTIPSGKGGKYLLWSHINLDFTSGLSASQYWLKNGGQLGNYITAVGGWAGAIMFVAELAVGDYVQIQVRQGSGGSKNTATGIDCQAGLVFLGA